MRTFSERLRDENERRGYGCGHAEDSGYMGRGYDTSSFPDQEEDRFGDGRGTGFGEPLGALSHSVNRL